MKTLNYFILILFVLSLNTFAVHASNDLIKNINIDGLKRIEKETVITYSNLNINDVYTDEKGNDALKNLFDTDLFSNIEISFNGNILNITVIENPTINLISFKGNKKINDEDLLIELSLKERSIYSRSKVKKDVEKMLTLYQRGGRLSTEINPTVEVLDNNRVNLVYEIEESDIAEVSKITIIGNNEFTSGKIRSVMKTKQKSLLKLWSSSDNYDPDKIDYDKQLITELYNNNGYPNFKFTSSIAQLIPNRNSFEIILTIREGDKYNFGKVTAESVLDRLSTDTIVQLVSIKEGNIYNQSLIKDSLQYIKDQAAVLGYAFVDITPSFFPNPESKSMDIMFNINEGPRVYVNKINVYGNTRTIDKVIRRQVKLTEGDAYNKYAIDLSKGTIRSLNFFSDVDIEEEKIEQTDRINLNISVKEKNTGEISMGAGYSSSQKATLQLGLKEQNFLGKGQKAKFQGSFGDTTTTYDISFEEPYYRNRELSLRGDLYSRFSDPASVKYETQDLGVGFSIGFPLSPLVKYSFNYSLYTTEVKADSDASTYEKLLAGTDTISAVRNIVVYDMRNSPYKPSSGSLTRFDSQLAGLGGTSYYVKNTLDYRVYKRLSKRFIGSFKAEGGHLNGYNGEDAPASSNYKLGGKSLRGFKSGKVGPIGGTSHYGGHYYYLTSLETNFDLPLDEFDITSTFFVDVGSVWGLDSRYGSIDDEHNMRASAGINFNWDAAIGPINLVYATALSKESTDSVDNFYFDIGYNFWFIWLIK